MQIVCISRGTFAGGKNLAEQLASQLGYDCLSREELMDAATGAGIAVGKLEMAVAHRRPMSEQLDRERRRYTSFVTSTICERALTQSLVYHGRTAHLSLPGATNVLRIRTIQNPERRVEWVMQRLHLSREKARRYNEQVDEDRRRWVRTLYNIDWEDPAHYDTVINLSHMSVDNAASSHVSMAQLPEFQVTPATHRVIEDLLLASRCRLALGADPHTGDLSVTVKADCGRVSVTYLPRQQQKARSIPDVLHEIDGVRELLCTMATTSLLWVQQCFDPKCASLAQILEIAGKWNAAVELVQLEEGPGKPPGEVEMDVDRRGGLQDVTKIGGILDDGSQEDLECPDEDLKHTRARLIAAGRAGGVRIMSGDARTLLESLDRTAPYSLIVVGDVFMSKVDSVRKRLSREMVSYLSDHLRVPVIGADELQTQFLFGPAQWLRLLAYGAIAALMFGLVFTHQTEILTFMSREGTGHRILSTAALLAFVPAFAYVYGNFGRYLLRLFRFE